MRSSHSSELVTPLPQDEAPAVDADRLYDSPVKTSARRDETVFGAPCDVCGGDEWQPYFDVEGTRFQIERCRRCDLGRLSPAPTDEELASFYPASYYGDSGEKFAGAIERMVHLVGSRHARFLFRLLPRGGRVLDVGCGRGVLLRTLADAGLATCGFEVSRAAVTGIDRRVELRIAPTLAEAAYPDAFFDGVILWHVLEHVPAPREQLQEVHRILKPGGKLVVAVPNFSSLQARWSGPAWFHLDVPRHLFHFPAAALRQLLESTGFDCRRTHHFSLRQNPFGWIQSTMNRISHLPRNGLYVLLHRRGDRTAPPFTPSVRMQLRVLFWLLTPPAIFLSIVAAVFRSGATIHIVATRRPEVLEVD